jgi:hypothetical protein
MFTVCGVWCWAVVAVGGGWGGCGPCSQFVGSGGPSSPLRGGGGGPSSPLAGGGDVPLLGHRRCGWGPCLSLVGYDAGPSSAAVVGPRLLHCPSLFLPSFHCIIIVWCRQCALSSYSLTIIVHCERKYNEEQQY